MIRRPPRSTLFPYTTLFRSAPRLTAELARLLLLVDLFPVHEPQCDGSAGRKLTLPNLEETLRVSHRSPPESFPRPRPRQGRGLRQQPTGGGAERRRGPPAAPSPSAPPRGGRQGGTGRGP